MSTIERKAGFSLLEMMAVMLIIALLSTLVIAATPGTGRAGLEALALDTAAMLRRERVRSILVGRSGQVWLDSEHRLLIADDGDQVAIPKDIVLDLLGVDVQRDGRPAVARFEPDGSSSGAVLRFSREGAGYEIRINWYTGAVAVAAM